MGSAPTMTHSLVGVPSGMTVRESGGPITDNFSNFIPHVYVRLIRRIERMRRTPQTVEA